MFQAVEYSVAVRNSSAEALAAAKHRIGLAVDDAVGDEAAERLTFVRADVADRDAPDGTGVHDYVHVMDLAEGHAAALAWMAGRAGYEVFNLGTGNGTSVLEIIRAFSEACGRDLPYVIEPRRAGDVTANWADCAKAREVLGWEARYGIAEMCRDSWNWQSHNPNGYED